MSSRFDLKMILKEILSGGEAAPKQFYLVDLAGTTQSVSRPDGGHLLYSLDDVDRDIGAVRLYPKSSLLFITKAPEIRKDTPPSDDLPTIELTSQDETVGSTGKVRMATASGFSLIEAELSLEEHLKDRDDLILRVSRGDRTDEWPAIMLGSSNQSRSPQRPLSGDSPISRRPPRTA